MIDYDLSEKEEAVEVVARRSDLSLLAARERFEGYVGQCVHLKSSIQALVVKDEAGASAATQLGGMAAKLLKTVKGTLDETIDPANSFIKEVRAMAAELMNPLTEAKTEAANKLRDWQAAQELERRKAEKEALKAQEENQALLDALAKDAGVAPVIIEPPRMPGAKKKIQTGQGTSYVRETWTFEIVDEEAVPREYLMVDEKRIREMVRAGIREIPGVKIFQDSKIGFRS